MSKNLSAKYYQENKERLQKKARERYQNHFKEEKEKKKATIWLRTLQKISQKIKYKSLLSIEKKYYRMRKIMPHYSYKKLLFKKMT